MKEKIELLEKENLSQKPWQLIGEATAAKRPKNSLLEEHLTFDQTLVGGKDLIWHEGIWYLPSVIDYLKHKRRWIKVF